MGKNFCKIEKKWCKLCQHENCLFSEKTPLNLIHRCPKLEAIRTIRLKDYVQDVSIEDIMLTIIKYWPSQEKNKNGYASVLEKLKTIKANKTLWFINVERITEDDDTYLNVSGISPNNHYHYSMEFAEWAEWAGMNITKETLNNISKEEIIAAILYEMTYHGFEEENVINTYNDLQNAYKEMREKYEN